MFQRRPQTPNTVVQLSTLDVGESAIVTELTSTPSTTYHLLELGVSPGQRIRVCRRAPLGGPVEIELLSYRLALRLKDAETLWVTRV